MTPANLILTSCLTFLISCQPGQKPVPEVKETKLQLPFEMPEVQIPSFKTDTFNLLDYGGVADGEAMNTAAFSKAFQACSEAGGGVVLVPPGIWLTGPIVLKSDINLHLSSGALIRFSGNIDDYPLVDSWYEGWKSIRCQSPVSGRDLENVAITGRGIIDGNGGNWRQVKKEKLTDPQWKSLLASGGATDGEGRWYPSEQSRKANELVSKNGLPKEQTIENMAPYRHFLRPVMISLINCRIVLLEGVTFQNSPAWNVHPLMCEHLTLRNLIIRNPWFSQNGDGLDLESCRIGTITNCSFDVGDDAICIKSGKDVEGRERGKPTELFVISDCVVYHGHGGFVVGSEMSGGVRNLYVTNCTFIGTDCGLRFKSLRGRGGVVEYIWMDHIRMIDIPTEAIRFNLFYASKSPSEDPLTGDLIIDELPVNKATPAFRNMHFNHIVCDGAKQALMIQGLPEMPVENLVFENMKLSSEKGITVNYAKGLTFKNVSLDIQDGNAVRMTNGQEITFSGLRSQGHTQLYKIGGDRTRQIVIQSASRPVTYADIETPENLKQQIKLDQ